MYYLSKEDQNLIAQEPEFGMGYHLAKTDESLFVIFNSEYAVSLSEIREQQNRIPERGVQQESREGENLAQSLERIFGESEQIDHFSEMVSDFFNIESPLPQSIAFSREQPFHPESLIPRVPFSPIPRLSQITRQFEGFIRVSASPNDNKITEHGEVLPGTYASTTKDFEEVPSGFSAVGRYALPKPVSARFAYVIIPDRDTNKEVVGGTVRPAFGQSGGGVEVQFPNGLPPGSAHPEPYLIPTI